jgi:transposase
LNKEREHLVLGHKVRVFKPHTEVRLDEFVPKDNFYRHVEQTLDLSFVRDLVRDFYSPMGRPSIDPVVFFKLQLIMFFEGIRSERQLMEMVTVNLAHRWFIGYDLDEDVPDHSSLSKIRERYGLETFQRFFEHIVELCIESGLVWGEELYFDSTKVQANAALESAVPTFFFAAKQHLQHLFSEGQPLDPENGQVIGGGTWAEHQPNSVSSPRSFVAIYSKAAPHGKPGTWYQRTSDNRLSLTDPDATPMKRFNGDRPVLGYHDHYVVDGGKARIILAALITPASIMDNTPMLDLARWVRFRWRVHPRIAVGDTKYGTATNIMELEQDGIRAFVPILDTSKLTRFYSPRDFTFDNKRNTCTCPQGHEFPHTSRSKRRQLYFYRANAEVCNACPVKHECTRAKGGRSVSRSVFYEYIDQVKTYYGTPAFKKAMRKRKLWPEPLFGEAKQWHNLRRFRLRGLWKVNTEGLLVATGQNLKRLLAHKGWGKRRGPAGWNTALAFSPLFPVAEMVIPGFMPS